MEIRDFLVAPVYIFITYIILFLFRDRLTTPLTKPFFIPAFTAKVIGFIIFAFIYQFYYMGGDTFFYFKGAKVITNIFYDNPFLGLKIMFLESGDYGSPLYQHVKDIVLFRSKEEWNIVKYGGFLSIFTFKSYLGLSLFFALFSFFGIWKIYQVIVAQFPEIAKSLGLMMLFAPSTIFWGSGYMKDTMALGAVCFWVAAILEIILFRRKLMQNGFLVLLCSYLLISLKIYLLLCVIPAIGVWWFIRVQRSIKLLSVKLMMLPVLIGFIAVVGYLGVTSIAAQSETFSDLGAIGKKVQGFHDDHGTRETGSTYTLGEIEYSFVGFISKIPISVRVALFQPFPWEVKNIVMLLSSVESTIYLFLTLLIFFKRGIYNCVKSITSHPMIGLCATFTLLLAYIVGFTSFNYGALVRFKIPFLPFLGAALVLIYYLPKYKQLAKQEFEKEDAEGIAE